MFKKFLMILILICALSIIGCEDNKSPENGAKGYNKTHFSIFLVEGSKTSEIDLADLDRLQIGSKPYLTESDIDSYNWKNHTMILKNSRPFSEMAEVGTGFIVMAEKQRIFSGQILSPAISSTRSIPVILETKTELKILKGYPDDTYGKSGDPRKDIRIYEALKRAKILVE